MYASVQNDRKSRSGYKRHAIIGVSGTLGTFKYCSKRVSLYECKKFPSLLDYHAQ
jgi:hypothetical protein